MCGVRAAVFVAAQVGAGLGGGAVLQRRVPTACEGRGAGGLSWRPWIRVWRGLAGGGGAWDGGRCNDLPRLF